MDSDLDSPRHPSIEALIAHEAQGPRKHGPTRRTRPAALRSALGLLLLAVAGCATTPTAPLEQIELPADPSLPGAPVGVTRVPLAETQLTVWYPAAESVIGTPTHLFDGAEFVPDCFLDRVGTVAIPNLDSGGVRDAPLRHTGEALPIVVFSHGFGAFGAQSSDYASHLASRGYLVVAADHPGRMLEDTLPITFIPPLDCPEVSGLGSEDPAGPHIEALLDWLDGAVVDPASPFFEAIDTDTMALTGMSAGASTAAHMATTAERRFSALLIQAGRTPPAREIPTLLMGGSCDAMAQPSDMEATHRAAPWAHRLDIAGAGHLAFSNVCDLQMDAVAEAVLFPRDDINPTLLAEVLSFATDGCPGVEPARDLEAYDDCAGGYRSLEESAASIRAWSTTFLDDVLKGEGPGLAGLTPGPGERYFGPLD